MKPLDPIAYDYSGLIAPEGPRHSCGRRAWSRRDLKWLAPRLAAAPAGSARQPGGLGRAAARAGGIAPLDAAFFDLPERLLDEDRPLLGPDHRRRRPPGEGSRPGGRAGHRRLVHGRPGAVRGLLPSVSQRDFPPAPRRPAADLLRGQQRRQRRHAGALGSGRGDDDWGIIVISKSGGTLETAVAFRIFLEALRKSCGGDEEKLRRRVIAVTGQTGRLRDLADALGCQDVFPIPDGVGGRFPSSPPWACCRRP